MKLIYILFGVLVLKEIKSEWQTRKECSYIENNRPSIGVIDGNRTSITKYPFMVSLQVNGREFGSAIIVHPSYLVTPAYNVIWTKYTMDFRAGSSKYDEGGQALKVKEIYIHPNFSLGNQSNNVAVVELAEKLKFGKKVQPVKLGTRDLKPGTEVVITGWGAKDHSGEPSRNLRAGIVTIMDWEPCNKNYSGVLTDSIMCTFDLNSGPALHDFGDPLIWEGKVRGLYIGGNNCGPYQNPKLHCNIAAVYDWVQSVIEKNEEPRKVQNNETPSIP